MNMMEMMNKIRQAQARIKEAQKDLVDVKATEQSGGGLVSVTVNGNKDLVALDIDPSILNVEDKTLVQDLVIAAANKALREVEAPAREKLRQSTEDIIPHLPGMDLGSLLR